MESPNAPVIWLAYVSYPVTTAVYYERALRRNCRVVTAGPKIGPEVVKAWNLEALKRPILDHDLQLPFEPDMREAIAAAGDRFPEPDLYLWIESVPGHFPKHLESLKCPKACIFIDSHLNLDWHVKWAQQFDYVFIAQREYLEEFRRNGSRNVNWLPLACDPEVHSKKTSEKIFDIGFVGSVFENTPRANLLKKLADKRFHMEIGRCFWDEMALVFSKSRIVFNNAIRNDLNMRVFEALSTGSFLLTDLPANSGQDELFENGEDLGIYNESTLLDKIRYYLINEEEREYIARRGQLMVHKAHTYSHRSAELLQVSLHGKQKTPSAAEWRERSLVGMGSERKWRPKPPSRPTGRSFIIPVIDGSEKGKREFGALLDDLSKIDGEVIVVFNSAEAAEAFSNHPRIDIFASLNVNSGVARAWNIGVHLSSEPTLFILNADLRIGQSAIEELEKGLWELPSAAIVGPEGSFFGFYTYEDIIWFNHECQPTSPQLVDAISGFFFAAKRDLFIRRILQFEDTFTPCFTEEWDLGLQARQAGYNSYVIPVKDYRHEWGVSAQPNRTIRYLKNHQARAREIIARNRIHFWRKWLEISGELSLPPSEANGPTAKPPTGPTILQSKIIELSSKGESSSPTRKTLDIFTIKHRDLFPHVLNFLGLLKTGVEVGVQSGTYSEVILNHWKGERLFCVDPWRTWDKEVYVDPANVSRNDQEQIYEEAKRRLATFESRAVILRKTSAEAATQFATGSLDFVYLDAQHHYEAIRADLHLWHPKIKRGGFLCGHDFRDDDGDLTSCGVRTAVSEFLGELKLSGLVISEVEDSWFVRIP